jgi:hypothetical protein
MQQQVQTQALNAGHRAHSFAAVFAFEHKDRVNQIVHAQGVLSHQAAGEVIAAQTARAARWKGDLAL